MLVVDAATLSDLGCDGTRRAGQRQATGGGRMYGMARVTAPPETSAIDVAEYFLNLAATTEEEPDYLSPMRLQKLLYYAQAWSLANRDRPLFHEKIEAWTHGPVVRNVYARFADCGDEPILPDGKPTKLAAEDQRFVRSVWDAYKGFSAIALRNMTHREAPWLQAYRGPSDGRAPGIVSHRSMQEYFAPRATTA
jgi:uncharacterized phage-associated protein